MWAGHFVRMRDGHWLTSKALRMLWLSTLFFWEPFQLHWFTNVHICGVYVCGDTCVTLCTRESEDNLQEFSSTLRVLVTELRSSVLVTSSFTRWATSPVLHLSFRPFFQEDSEGSGELSGHGQGSTFNSIWWRIPSVMVPFWDQKTSKWLSCGLKGSFSHDDRAGDTWQSSVSETLRFSRSEGIGLTRQAAKGPHRFKTAARPRYESRRQTLDA